MTKELFSKSTDNLRKAIPLMIKHKVPTTPTNYALWYTYVSDDSPELNKEMDKVIENYGTCPPASGENLYRTHVADKAETDFRQLRQSLESIMLEIGHTMSDTLADTGDYQKVVDKCFDELNRVEEEGLSVEEVMDLVRTLVAESREIRNSTRFFNSQLNGAQDEIKSLKNQLEKVQKDALYDALTGLLNRRAFNDELAGLCSNLKDDLCLILVDIDYFKNFNDEYGHLFGDLVLKAVARRLQLSCRDGIQAFRYGGEEFAILIPHKKMIVVRQLAESMRRALEKLSVKDKRSGRQVGNITASFGVAECHQSDSVSAFIDKADKQLYEAKRLGRNRVLPINV